MAASWGALLWLSPAASGQALQLFVSWSCCNAGKYSTQPLSLAHFHQILNLGPKLLLKTTMGQFNCNTPALPNIVGAGFVLPEKRTVAYLIRE